MIREWMTRRSLIIAMSLKYAAMRPMSTSIASIVWRMVIKHVSRPRLLE